MASRYIGILVMIVIMIITGYFIMTTLITRDTTFNLNKVYSVMLMAIVGGLAELAMMHRREAGDLLVAGALVLVSIWLVVAIRRQLYIGGEGFLKAMIEHHAMAVAMSDRVLEKAPRADVAALATNIILAQEAEIGLMRGMLQTKQSLKAMYAKTGSPFYATLIGKGA